MNPSIRPEFPPLQPVLKEKSLQETVKTELKLEGAKNSVSLEENLPLRLITLKGCQENDYQFDNQSSGTTSTLLTPSKKGELCLTIVCICIILEVKNHIFYNLVLFQ